MAQVKICDICGEKIDPRLEKGFRVKMLKETFDYEGWRYKHWEEIDMCIFCLDKLRKMCTSRKIAPPCTPNNGMQND